MVNFPLRVLSTFRENNHILRNINLRSFRQTLTNSTEKVFFNGNSIRISLGISMGVPKGCLSLKTVPGDIPSSICWKTPTEPSLRILSVVRENTDGLGISQWRNRWETGSLGNLQFSCGNPTWPLNSFNDLGRHSQFAPLLFILSQPNPSNFPMFYNQMHP